jgi:imidazolonepropionase-like amidohydrolase
VDDGVRRAATIDSADAIGFAKDLGSLEVGKLADLIRARRQPFWMTSRTLRDSRKS